MAHRINVLLTRSQYRMLDEEANRSGVSIAEQMRRAIDTVYGVDGDRKVLQITHELGRRPGRRLG